ncbi:hypothetical protein CYMTET_39659 [Cymbomonas tetramitiformis]|uniref:Uncharacterized protein n=1 Tax=Cymbomonas tetramitiformis TaxID=36881 RepID=A0AAE0C9P8_9CHLO|nr:hypothetical protein CYMTET_39659 [Cymbomonas tetramitiformis]
MFGFASHLVASHANTAEASTEPAGSKPTCPNLQPDATNLLADTMFTKYWHRWLSRIPDPLGVAFSPRSSLVLGKHTAISKTKTAPNDKRRQRQDFIHLVLLGIAEAKGLEFPEVAVVDFFSHLPSGHQRAWKQLLQGDADVLGASFQDGLPELECQLKLLYTAVTRCCRRLVLVETTRSSAADAFSRWLSSQDMAEKYISGDPGAARMTNDEWRVRGIDYALNAEAAESVEERIPWLMRAVGCFERAGDPSLGAKARIQVKAALLCQKVQACEQGRHDIALKVEVVNMICACIRDALALQEAADLGHAIAQHYPERTQEMLRVELMDKIETLIC